MINTHAMDAMIRQVTEEIDRREQECLAKQLGELISRGLLVVEKGDSRIIQDYDPAGGLAIRVVRDIKLVLKEQEYIERLEKENAELRIKIGNLAAAARDIHEVCSK